jgi:hypothetical protein
MFFQLGPNADNKPTRIRLNLMRVGSGDPGVISIPIGIPRLVPMEPFKEPFLRSPHLAINRDWGFTLQILLNSQLSQSFLFHRITSWVGFLKDIIKQFQPQGNRCIDTKTDIKGNLCSDTSGLPMY